jgi:hypothetical protein
MNLMNDSLARACVTFDRCAFHFLKMSDPIAFDRVLKASEARVKAGGGFADFNSLWKEGCDREELLWLLVSCRDTIVNIRNVFGQLGPSLSQNLKKIRRCADFVERLNCTLFGALAKATPGGTQLKYLPETLRKLAELAENAKREFKNAKWFLRIAKVRLTDHVIFKCRNGEPHDKQVSGLIAAVTGKDYSEDAQRRFRHKYKHLLSNRYADPDGNRALDPYTVRSDPKRQKTIDILALTLTSHSETRRVIEEYAWAFVKIAEKTSSTRPNRKRPKRRI